MKNILITIVALISIQAFADVTLTFSSDKRPVDGLFTELTLYPGSKSNMIYYTDVRMTEEFMSRMTGTIMARVVLEKRNMICRTFFVKRSRIIKSIVCTKDDRAVDGALTKLSIARNDSRTFDVSLFTSYISRRGQGNIDKTEDLAFGLTLL